MHILLTLNKNYLKQAIIMLRSLIDHNKTFINVHIISNDIFLDDFDIYQKYLPNTQIIIETINDSLFEKAPTSKRYPRNIYYRLFASLIIKDEIQRILYLDPDIIINGDLSDFYNQDFCNNLFVGATTIKGFLRKFNEIKNKAPKGAPYVNTGVLLMNLEELRKVQDAKTIVDYINKMHYRFTLPDQDILSALYGSRIKLVEATIYNLSDRGIKFYNFYNSDKIDYNFVVTNTKIIHYYGRNKPWKTDYKGILKPFFDKYNF